MLKPSDLAALEFNAERAGLVFGCCYSTAAEYEAELIRARRAAGRYRSPWKHRATCAVALLGAAVVTLSLLSLLP